MHRGIQDVETAEITLVLKWVWWGTAALLTSYVMLSGTEKSAFVDILSKAAWSDT